MVSRRLGFVYKSAFLGIVFICFEQISACCVYWNFLLKYNVSGIWLVEKSTILSVLNLDLKIVLFGKHCIDIRFTWWEKIEYVTEKKYKILHKLSVFTKFPYQEFRWNYCILYIVCQIVHCFYDAEHNLIHTTYNTIMTKTYLIC